MQASTRSISKILALHLNRTYSIAGTSPRFAIQTHHHRISVLSFGDFTNRLDEANQFGSSLIVKSDSGLQLLTSSIFLRFTLIDTRTVKPLHEGPIPTPAQAGVQSLDLKDLGLALEPDVQYRWYISAIRNPDSPSQDIVAGGMIERCEFSTCLVEMEVDLSCDQPSVVRNAVRGFWYDAVSCLCDLIKTNPQDPSFRRMRASLLKQVGLNGVAEWDLKSAPPEK